MRFSLAALFLLAGTHGGSDCAHTGSAGHSGGGGHGTSSNSHLATAASAARAAGSFGATHAAPDARPHFGHALAAGFRDALVAAFDAILSIAANPDGPSWGGCVE